MRQEIVTESFTTNNKSTIGAINELKATIDTLIAGGGTGGGGGSVVTGAIVDGGSPSTNHSGNLVIDFGNTNLAL